MAAKDPKAWLHCARVTLTESRTRRLSMWHLPWQRSFSWWLQNSAANDRQRYIAEKAAVTTSNEPAQADLFGGSPC